MNHPLTPGLKSALDILQKQRQAMAADPRKRANQDAYNRGYVQALVDFAAILQNNIKLMEGDV